MLFLDVLINLNLGYYEGGEFVNERWLIFQQYARFDLYVDLYCAAIVLITYLNYSLALNILKLLFVMKVRRLAQYD